MGKQLYYFTASYPWGVGQTWKTNELTYLREYFDRITVVPFCNDGNFDSPKELPRGVVAEPPLFRDGAPRIDWRSASEIVGGNAKYYVSELVRKRPYLRRRHFGSWLGASIQVERLWRHPVMRRIVETRSKDVVLCFFWGRMTCDMLPLVDKRDFGNVVVRFHRFDLFEDENDGYIPYRRQLLESITLAAPSSESGCAHLRALYPDVTTPIRLLRLGVPRVDELAMSDDGVLRILSCSNVLPRKRVQLIADALQQVRVPVHWTHVGDGPLMAALRQSAATLPPNVQTHFPGNIDTGELWNFYTQRPIDVFVNVSTSEGVAMSILECLSAGVPVIATDVGGSADAVDDTVGALLPSDASAQRLAETFERFHALSIEEKRSLRQAAIRRHRERYDVEKLTHQLGQLLVS